MIHTEDTSKTSGQQPPRGTTDVHSTTNPDGVPGQQQERLSKRQQGIENLKNEIMHIKITGMIPWIILGMVVLLPVAYFDMNSQFCEYTYTPTLMKYTQPEVLSCNLGLEQGKELGYYLMAYKFQCGGRDENVVFVCTRDYTRFKLKIVHDLNRLIGRESGY